MTEASLTIALIPNKMLGDGIISLILANNLHQNGFRVTVFHDYLINFHNWLNVDIKATDIDTLNESCLQQFDIVLADTYSRFTQRYTQQQLTDLSQWIIFFSSGKLGQEINQDHVTYLRKRLTGDKARYIYHFSHTARVLKLNPHQSMVENMTAYCRDTLKLDTVSSNPGLSLPESLMQKKHPRRIIISPTSSESRKEWSADKFIALAKKLKDDGFTPVFSFAPKERKQWLTLLNNEFTAPEFKTVKAFAETVYQSGLLIGNDSGSGHLASALGIPVLTIVTSPRKKIFRWRPGWGKNKVIAPYFTYSFSGKRYWRDFLPVKRVYKAFHQLFEDSTPA